MRILYDHQIFERHRVGGISRYFADLCAWLTATHSAEWELSVRFSDNEYLKHLPLAAPVRSIRGDFEEFCGGLRFRGKRRMYDARQRLFPDREWQSVNRASSLRRIAAGEYDLFHPTYYDPYFLKAIGSRPYVLTIHDMIPELYCEYYPLDDPTALWKRALVERAAGLIAVSENTRNDLVEILGVPAEKIAVIHHGTAYAEASPGVRSGSPPPDLPERYLLYIGTRDRYKNLYFFLLALRGILEQEPDLHVVCTGFPFSAEEELFFRSLNVLDRMHSRYASEQELFDLYGRAQAMILPSLYEGFGFPILEAFARGCPVIAARGSSLPEVGGEAALYFDPKGAASIRDAVGRVLNDGTLRSSMAHRGAERVKCFSIPAMGERTLEFYRKVLGPQGSPGSVEPFPGRGEDL